jgi:predicted nucleotidyltransferase
MIITKETTIAGLPIVEIRRFLRKLGDVHDWNIRVIEQFFHNDHRSSSQLRDALLAEGLIEMVGGTYIRSTTKGLQLSMASLRQYKRKTGLRDLDRLVERAVELNDESETGWYAHYVTKAVLFGSLLDPARQTVSDVDVAIELVKKSKDHNTQSELEQVVLELHEFPRNMSLSERSLYGPTWVVYRSLRNRSHLLHIMPIEDLAHPTFANTAFKVIYRYDPTNKRHHRLRMPKE